MDRKAFNFYKSYYDVLLELPDKEKLPFLMAIFEMQFNGTEPKSLKGMAKFAFISQRHSLIRQLTGYKSGILGGAPPKGSVTIPPKGTSNQDKGEEEEQVQVEEQGADTKTQIFGRDSTNWFVVKRIYAHENPARVNKDGLNEYLDKFHFGFRFKKPYLEEILWKEWDQKAFKSHDYFNTVAININNKKEWIAK